MQTKQDESITDNSNSSFWINCMAAIAAASLAIIAIVTALAMKTGTSASLMATAAATLSPAATIFPAILGIALFGLIVAAICCSSSSEIVHIHDGNIEKFHVHNDNDAHGHYHGNNNNNFLRPPQVQVRGESGASRVVHEHGERINHSPFNVHGMGFNQH